jgi:hypothetical protein
MIVSFHPQKNTMAGEKKDLSNQPGKIAIISSGEISHPTLRNYLRHRQIPLAIANEFCRKVTFVLYGKKNTVLSAFKIQVVDVNYATIISKEAALPKNPLN